MPKLNVQQNNQNVIQAFRNALAIGNLKGIIASDGSHNFSTAGSNRNLLDNPWFTVRQRGDGPFTGAVYTVDRWKISGGNPTITPLTGYGVTLAQTTNTAFEQLLDPALMPFYNGKTLTLSVYTSAGIFSGTGTLNTSVSAYSIRFLLGTTGFRAGLYNNGTSYWFARIDNPSAGTYSVDIYAMKLELGSVSTLANDAPPNYAEELRKCQYYFVRLHETANYGYFPVGFGAEQASSALRMAIMTPTSLRRAPVTVSFSGTLNITGNGTRTTVTSMSILDVSDTAVLASVVPASMPANQHTYTLSFGAQAYIDLSADL